MRGRAGAAAGEGAPAAPPVRVAPAQIYVERPEVIVRPSQVIVEPPQVHMQNCRDGERCRPASAPAPRSDGY